MDRLSRRRLLKSSAALGAATTLPLAATSASGEESHHFYESWDGSPELEKFVKPLPIPDTREAEGRIEGAPYHQIPAKEAQHSFHPDLPDTTIWGFDGQFPGPILETDQYRRLRVEFGNSSLPDEHLFEVDETIKGTTSGNYVGYDGPVPETRTSTHFHGLKIATASDGQADMWTSPDGVEGPRFEQSIQRIPNRQARLTSVYHDHTRGISRLNNYAGLVGAYVIKGSRERNMDLPEGEYDVPLVLADRGFEDDGSLYYPDEFVPNFAGDVATVNGAAWPTFEVEPRRYRFRILNPSNGRTYGLNLAPASDGHDDGHGDEGGEAPSIYQVSAGHGFLEEVVEIGHGGDMEQLTISPFERAEVVVDFSEHAGETFTLTNDADFPYSGGSHGDEEGTSEDEEMDHGGGSHPQIHEIMQFEVADNASGRDRSKHPTGLQMPYRHTPNERAAQETREITMEMVMGSDPSKHTLNGKSWGDDIEIRPQLGSTEVWEITNDSDHTHPLHLHLVEFTVVGRGHDGTEPPLPNERGGKDVVRVDPDETVRIAVKFQGFAGKYPFHCHVLEHEEHEMMRMFEVVTGNGRGQGQGNGNGGGNGGNGRGN